MESSPRQSRTMAKHEAEELAENDAERAAAERAAAETIEDTDDLLADIDALLEEQSVLTNFRQKGGE